MNVTHTVALSAKSDGPTIAPIAKTTRWIDMILAKYNACI